jgi:OAH/OAS sulfhydrylase
MANLVWAGGSGSWADPAQWEGGVAPGPDGSESIAAGTVVLAAGSSLDAQAVTLFGTGIFVATDATLGNRFTLDSASASDATFAVQGSVGTSGTLAVGAGTLDLATTADAEATGDLLLLDGAQATIAAGGTLALSGMLTNFATITVGDGGTFLNDGTIAQAHAAFEVESGGTLTGGGSFAIGLFSSLYLQPGAAASGQDVTFTDVGGRLLFGDPATYSGTIEGFRLGPYVFEDADHAASLFNLHDFGHLYSRVSNPTVAVLEERVATLEGGRAGLAAASGHAAQFLIFFTLLEPGDEFIASRNLYGGSLTQFGLSFKRLGWTCHFVDPTEPENFRRALTPRCKGIFIESLANPGGIVIDIQAVAAVAHAAGIPLIVDNTLATPYLCRPIEWGADIVCHSTTKFLAGHGNSLGGVIVESGRFDWAQAGKFPSLCEPEPAYHGLNFFENFGDFAFTTKARSVALRDFGPTMAPLNAFLTITGIETLPVRMERHVANARRVAEFLAAHEQVAWVSYAGLPGSPFHRLAEKYLPKGAGAVMTFGVTGGYAACIRLVESVQLFSHLANVGDTRSLILHPASTTHRQLSDEQRSAAGAGPDVIRLSVGLETPEDLIRDLDQALQVSANTN